MKKYILMSQELLSSPVGVFFQESGFDLHVEYNQNTDYDFIINDVFPELKHFPRLQTTEGINPEVLPFVRSYVHTDLFVSTKGKQMLSSYFVDGQDVDLVDRFSKEFKQIFNFKVHDYLNMGFFIDSIVVEAYRGKFNITDIRNYLNTVLLFAFNKTENTKEQMPLDVSYSHDGEAFTIQVSASSVEDFKGKEEIKDIFGELTDKANYFDVAYFTKKKKLMVSSLFFRDAKLKNSKSFFFTEVGERSKIQSPKEDSEIVSGLINKESVKYQPQKVEDFQSRKLAVARKFTVFIKNFRINEENPLPLEQIDVAQVESYLARYPRQEAVTEADEEVKRFICKLLKDEQLNNGITEYVQKVAGSNMDAHVPEFQRILGSKSLDDIEEILTIHGKNVEERDATRVKGWLQGDNDKVVVSGNKDKDTGMSDRDIWEIRKSQLNVKIDDEVRKISTEGKNVLKEDIIKVIASQLKADETDVQTVVSGIIEEALSSELIKKQKLEESFALKILGSQGAEQVREKLEGQIAKMKKLMDQMKREIIKLQNEKTIRDAKKAEALAEEGESESLMQLKLSLDRSEDALKSKERMLEKVKSDSEQLSKSKDAKIAQLEERIEELRSEFAKSKEHANEKKLQDLEVENKTLQSRLELAQKKVNIISGNIENRENELHEKREKELETLRANMQMAQSVIERFKQDKLDMETRYQEERETSRMLKESGTNTTVFKNELEERDNHISLLVNEKKILEEKFKTQAMELKKVEQKLKYSTSQLESSQKKAASGPGQKTVESYIKQVEQVTSRYKDATNEIAEKRKEIVKLKQENTLILSKLAELEKKLSLLDKKAA